MSEDANIDVRCLPYMPLEIERLRKSKAWLRCRRQPELAFYLMNLWMRAWHEVPAGSVEDDDDVLADAAMCDPQKWIEIREKVLVGWEKRGDRLYHSVVTELATEAFGKLRKNKNRTKAAREAQQQRRDEPVTQPVTEPVTESVTEPVTQHVTGPEGKGREEEKEEAKASSKKTGARLAADWSLPPEWSDWAVAEGLSEMEVKRQADRFRDYWVPLPGQKGVKLDWHATWRNWVRKSMDDRRGRSGGTGGADDEYRMLFGRP